ncbi:MAG: Flp family type IVb pilin [Dermatophilaceae bacterium]|nr:Flp family type IVb pilin [Dermatophilaceae bacterium]
MRGDEEATAAEYTVLAGLIALVVAVATFGLNVLTLFTSATARITDATP